MFILIKIRHGPCHYARVHANIISRMDSMDGIDLDYIYIYIMFKERKSVMVEEDEEVMESSSRKELAVYSIKRT